MADAASVERAFAPAALPGRRLIQRMPAPLLAAIACLVIWQAAAWLMGADALSAPMPSALRLWAMLGAPRYRPDFAATGMAFGIALLIVWLSGLLLAVWLGLSRLANDVAEPMLVSFYAIPKVTLYPVVLLLFGIGVNAVVAFGVMHGIVPVALIGIAAIRNLKPFLLRTARGMRLSRSSTVLHVLLPAIMPELLNAMRIGFSLTLLGVLIGEMFGGKHGLGFLLMRAIDNADNDTIMAIALLLLTVAITANAALGRLARRFADI